MAEKKQQLTVGEKIRTIGELLESKKDKIFKGLPRHVNAERLMKTALTSIRKNPKLLECSQASILSAISEAGELGLEPDGVLGHAYLVPYKQECVLLPGYKGLLMLVRRSGEIANVRTDVVHKGDVFSYRLGDDPFIEHQPNDDDPDRESQPITHVYLIADFINGGKHRVVWTQQRVDKHKEKYSEAWKSAEKSWYGKPPTKDSPWHTNWQEQARKTLVRYTINRGELPVSVEVQRLANREEMIESQSTVIDSHVVESVTDTKNQLAELTKSLAEKNASVAKRENSSTTTKSTEAPQQEMSETETKIVDMLNKCASSDDVELVRETMEPACKTEDEFNFLHLRCDTKVLEFTGQTA